MAHFPGTDLRGEKTFLICTMTICWPTLKPKEGCQKGRQLPPKAWKQTEDGAEPQEPGQVTYEQDRGLPEGGPGILGVLQALAEKYGGAVSVGIHLGQENPESAEPSHRLIRSSRC